MLDFSSSLYLGFTHQSDDLEPWQELTTGAPAALSETEKNRAVARSLAKLQGCERGVLAPSTLHLFWDLFDILGRKQLAIYHDAGIYPIARWGMERALIHGTPVRQFRHYDIESLERELSGQHQFGLRPLVVADGFCPGCGKPAPIRDFLECVRRHNGLLILDDTQALGILGHSPGPVAPYGKAGGGILQWSGTSGEDIIMVASLAKGFGVPMAILSGSRDMISLQKQDSKTRIHCSQPSTAIINAGSHALKLNSGSGDRLRLRLAQLVSRFRNRMMLSGFSTTGGLFPFQTIQPHPAINAATLHEHLLRRGIKTVLHNREQGKEPRISLIITIRHCLSDIDRVAEVIFKIADNNYTLMRSGR